MIISLECEKPRPGIDLLLSYADAIAFSQKYVEATTGGGITGGRDNTCSICLHTISEPLTTSCNHTYCRSCILSVIRDNASSNQDKIEKRSASCPNCRSSIRENELTDPGLLMAAEFLRNTHKKISTTNERER